MTWLNNITGTFATNIGKGVLEGLKQSVSDLGMNTNSLGSFSKTLSSLGHAESTTSEIINLTDMELSPGELSRILKLRDLAKASGAKELSLNLQNANYVMDIESFDMQRIA